ncbi:non-ribosomal peptide synthetase [Cognatiluteimonas telluris]|uniref:non-ribosomal peptide synthetase n=1 Tax=Cognatiluteimonas telluris TaxID=1104775 RepID=UPI00140E60DD|nr:non-ribosomal peptide synthetase [Lysobacter telluris]
MLASRGLAAPLAGAIPRRGPGLDDVCSFPQGRLWLLDQFEGAGAAYNMPGRIHLRGTIDVDALRRALDAIVARHEGLRAGFVHRDGKILQIPAPAAGGLAMPLDDLSGSSTEAVEAILAKEARSGFDLTRGPLIRARLLRLAADEHVLLLTMHHIVSDGWSLQVFAGELAALYAAFQQGLPSPLAPLPIQYADYAAWQRSEFGSEAGQARLAWWKRQLAGAPAVLELPLDRPRGVRQSFRGAEVPFALDAKRTDALRALAKREGLTLFMVLHAGFSILLSRLSRQEDVVVGTPVANRRQSVLENLIGFFVNTLALRVQVRAGATVGEFLGTLKESTLAAFEHQDTPFDQLVESLNPARTASYNPLFQVMFALQNAPRREAILPGLDMRLEMGGSDTAKFDLTLTLQESDDEGGLEGALNFASDLFDRETIERWSGHLHRIYDAIVEDPSRRIADLPLLSVAEHAMVVQAFNATRRDYPAGCLSHHLFEAQVLRCPDAIAVEAGDKQLTYAQLERRSNQLARHLRACGVGVDTPVGICVERGLDTAIGVLAILKAGGAYVPIDPDYPPDRVDWMLQDANPRVVLTHARLQPSLPLAGRRVILLDDDAACVAEQPGEQLPGLPGHGPEHLGYIIYTSGSTGRPKGVALPHRALVNLIHWHLEALRPARRVLQFASLSFDASFHELFAAWHDGGCIVIPDEEVRRDSRLLADFILARDIDKVILPVVMLHHLAERYGDRPEQFRGLREVLATGEQLKITPAVRQLFAQLGDARLHNHYGPSETHVVTAHTLPATPEAWPTYPSIGTPIANCRIYILDACGHPVPVGVVGEVWIGGVGVARGYLNRPELTSERFVADPYADESGATMYRSGDLGRWHADGSIEYLGRNDHQLKIRGFRVEPGEVESRLLEHPSIREAVVVGRSETSGDRRLIAYLTVGAEVGADALREHVRSALPDYMVPAAFVVLAEMPLTPNGKLDRDALPAPDRAAVQVHAYEPPQGEVEGALVEAWQDLLRLERVGRNDNFFELGGHSLLALQAVSRAADAFGVELGLRDLFDRQTPASLAAFIDTLKWAKGGLATARVPAGDERERATI